MSQRAIIDVTASPELRRVAEEVRATQEPIVLRLEGEEIAVLSPLAPARHRRRVPTQADIEAAMSAAGSWKGLVDVDNLKAEWRAARGSRRPPIDL